MREPGLGSRIGFRLMAWMMTFTRRGPRLAERLRASGVASGQAIVDYGCGPGFYTVEAARIVGEAGHVYAADVQPAAASMVRRRAWEADLGNVSTITTDRELPLPDGSIDLVLLYDAVAGIDDKRGVLAELGRVLKPGGVLSVWVEHGAPEDTLPLVTGNSRFVLRNRVGDVLNLTLPSQVVGDGPAEASGAGIGRRSRGPAARSSCMSKTVSSGSRRPMRTHARMAPKMPAIPLMMRATVTPSM